MSWRQRLRQIRYHAVPLVIVVFLWMPAAVGAAVALGRLAVNQ